MPHAEPRIMFRPRAGDNWAQEGNKMSIDIANRVIRAPRGTKLNCRGWFQEAALRMLCNNLDPEG
jgi:hypothetical protein